MGYGRFAPFFQEVVDGNGPFVEVVFRLARCAPPAPSGQFLQADRRAPTAEHAPVEAVRLADVDPDRPHQSVPGVTIDRSRPQCLFEFRRQPRDGFIAAEQFAEAAKREAQREYGPTLLERQEQAPDILAACHS